MRLITKAAVALFTICSPFTKIAANSTRGSLAQTSNPDDNIEVQLHFTRVGSGDNATVKTLQLSESHHFTDPRSSDLRNTLTALVGVYDVEPSLAETDTYFYFTSTMPEREIFCFLIYWNHPRSEGGLDMLSVSVKERESLILNNSVRAVECRSILLNG